MISVNNLDFSYDRNKKFFEDISFNVSEGEIFGFLGPSGAGKSTLQKILSGILIKYKGSVKVLDTEVKNRTVDFYENIGVDFEFPNLYGKFTGLENLKFFSSLYKNSIDPLIYIERLGLKDDMNKKVAEYSKGMKMRLAFIRAILHKPNLLFLDEPTSGLDPSYSRILKDIILELKNEGTTVILTTHNMHDAQELCDRVAFIVDGEIKAVDAPDNLKSKKTDYEVIYTFETNNILTKRVTMISKLKEDALFINSLEKGIIKSIHSKEPTLEDVFIELTGRRLL